MRDHPSATRLDKMGDANRRGKRSGSRRAILLRWLRRTHLYVGLWGAVLGLLFGATGILMNHRAILKIPVEKSMQKTAQLALPERPLASPQQMAERLAGQFQFTAAQVRQAKAQPAKNVIWAGREVMQPDRWNISLQSPQRSVSAEYFPGDRFVRLEQLDATPIGTLRRLHTAAGVNAFWVLLSDTVASSLMLLSIFGLLLWTQLHTVRTTGVVISHRSKNGFRNNYLVGNIGGSFLKWQYERRTQGLPKPPANGYRFLVDTPDVAWIQANRRVPSATWIGHATMLVQLGGVNVLTDPMLSDRASPVSFAGPKRHVHPGLNYQQLPHIDVVVISHNHYDHLDRPTILLLNAQQGRPRSFWCRSV